MEGCGRQAAHLQLFSKVANSHYLISVISFLLKSEILPNTALFGLTTTPPPNVVSQLLQL